MKAVPRLLLLAFVFACKAKAQLGPVPREAKNLVCTNAVAATSATRLLTRAEYNNAVRDILGDQTKPASAFPREPLAFGFDNNQDIYQATPESVQAYLQASEQVAQRAVREHKSNLANCESAPCGVAFVKQVGQRLFRRPLSTGEEVALSEFFLNVWQGEGSFDTAMEWTLQVMLQAPQFLYRIEPSSPNAEPRALNGYEVASRLSFFLWTSAPDDALLEAARNGVLDRAEGVAAQVERMVADPRFSDTLDHFFSQWLSVDGLEAITKDPAVYTTYPGRETLSSWKQSLLLYVRDVLANDGTLTGLLTSPTMFVDPLLANLYGVPPPPAGQNYYRIDTDPQVRMGLLTQPALLARLASPDQSSPVRRGVFVTRTIACRPLGDPPPDQAIIPPALKPGATTRERFTQHSADASCATCHSVIDPIGFGFEHFDGIGAYRETDEGKPIDARGSINRFREETLNGEFNGAGELAIRLANSPQVHDCFATSMYRFALGRVETELDACAIENVQQKFYASGGDIRTLMRAITEQLPFMQRAPKAEVAP